MPDNQTLDLIPIDTLLTQVRAMRQDGYRLVQIGATRLPDRLELTYSFEKDFHLGSLRVHLPEGHFQIPSISSVYWCAFLYENEIHDLFNLEVSGMAVDFQGSLYKTAVKYAFGSTKAPHSTATA